MASSGFDARIGHGFHHGIFAEKENDDGRQHQQHRHGGCDARADDAAGVDLLHHGGQHFHGFAVSSSMYMDIMKHLEGRGINIVVDATRNLLTNVLPYKPFLIKPNNHELGEIFGVEITDKDDVIKYAKKLQEQGARNVLVSMAGDGAVLVTEDGQEFKANAPKGKLKNSVGAGDSMVAGFVYGYLKSNDYKQAFIYGVCTGSASAFSEELATKPEVEALIDKWESASN